MQSTCPSTFGIVDLSYTDSWILEGAFNKHPNYMVRDERCIECIAVIIIDVIPIFSTCLLDKH